MDAPGARAIFSAELGAERDHFAGAVAGGDRNDLAGATVEDVGVVATGLDGAGTADGAAAVTFAPDGAADLGCGTGRLATGALLAGFGVTGVIAD